MRRFATVFIALLAVVSIACGDNAVPTEPTDVGPFSRTEVFTGTLARGGTSFYSIASGNTGSVAITFASARVVNTSTTLFPTVTIGFGVPRGIDCQTSQTVQASPSLQAQIRVSIEPGIYCIRIADSGGLSQSIDFAVRMTFPVEPIAKLATKVSPGSRSAERSRIWTLPLDLAATAPSAPLYAPLEPVQTASGPSSSAAEGMRAYSVTPVAGVSPAFWYAIR